MTTYAIRLSLETPIEINDLFHLDGLLAKVAVMRGLTKEDLPLASTDGLWHASAAILETGPFGAVDIRYKRVKALRREPLLDGFFDHLPKGDRVIGQMHRARTSLTTHRQTIGALAVWFAFEGDADVVCDMLRDVRCLGAGHRVGSGRRGEDLDLMTAASDAWLRLQDGRPARAVPLERWQGLGLSRHLESIVDDQAWRPDYHDAANRERCISPILADLRGTRALITGWLA